MFSCLLLGSVVGKVVGSGRLWDFLAFAFLGLGRLIYADQQGRQIATSRTAARLFVDQGRSHVSVL